jgi:hypothetical protein
VPGRSWGELPLTSFTEEELAGQLPIYLAMRRHNALVDHGFLDESCGQLFDRVNDPTEVRNLWTDPSTGRVERGRLDVLRDRRTRSTYHTPDWGRTW